MAVRRLDYRVGLETQEFRNQLMSMQADVSSTMNHMQPGLQGQPPQASMQGDQRRERTFRQDAGGGFHYNPGFATAAAGTFGVASAPPGVSQEQFQDKSSQMLAGGLAANTVHAGSIAGGTVAGVGIFHSLYNRMQGLGAMGQVAGNVIGRGFGGLAGAALGTGLGGAAGGALLGSAAGMPVTGGVLGGIGGMAVSQGSAISRGSRMGSRALGMLGKGIGTMAIPAAASFVGQEVFMEGAEAVNQFRGFERTLDRTSHRFMTEGKTLQAGSGFNDNQRAEVAEFLMDYENQSNFDSDEIQQLVAQGSSMGAFSGVGGASDFKQRFEQLSKKVKEITRVFKTSLDTAMDTVKELDRMGYGDTRDIKNEMSRLRSYSDTSGLSMKQVMGSFSQGAQMAQKMGLPGRAGADLAARMRSNIENRIQYGEIDQQTVRQQGGAGRMAMGMTSKMLQMFRGQKGLTLAGAFANDDFTDIDRDRLKQYLSGGTDQSLPALMAENLSENGYAKSQRKLMMNRKQLTTELAESDFAPYLGARMGHDLLERQGLTPNQENMEMFFRNQMGMSGTQAEQYASMATDPDAINRRIDTQIRQTNQRAVKRLRQKRWDQLIPGDELGRAIMKPFVQAEKIVSDNAVWAFRGIRDTADRTFDSAYNSFQQDFLGMPQQVNVNLPQVSDEFRRNNADLINERINNRTIPTGNFNGMNDPASQSAMAQLQRASERTRMSESVLYDPQGTGFGHYASSDTARAMGRGGMQLALGGGATAVAGKGFQMAGKGVKLAGRGIQKMGQMVGSSAMQTAGGYVGFRGGGMAASRLASGAAFIGSHAFGLGTVGYNLAQSYQRGGKTGLGWGVAAAGIGALASIPLTGGVSAGALLTGAAVGSTAGLPLASPESREYWGGMGAYAAGNTWDAVGETTGAIGSMFGLDDSTLDPSSYHGDAGRGYMNWVIAPETRAGKQAKRFQKFSRENPRRALAQLAYGESGTVNEGFFQAGTDESFNEQLIKAGRARLGAANNVEQSVNGDIGIYRRQNRNRYVQQRIGEMDDQTRREVALEEEKRRIRQNNEGLSEDEVSQQARQKLADMTEDEIKMRAFDRYDRFARNPNEATDQFLAREGRQDLQSKIRTMSALGQDIDMGARDEDLQRDVSQERANQAKSAANQYWRNHTTDKAPNIVGGIEAAAREMFPGVVNSGEVSERIKRVTAERLRQEGVEIPGMEDAKIAEQIGLKGVGRAQKLQNVGNFLRNFRKRQQGFTKKLANVTGIEKGDLNAKKFQKVLGGQDTYKAVRRVLKQQGMNYAGKSEEEILDDLQGNIEGLSQTEAERAMDVAYKLEGQKWSATQALNNLEGLHQGAKGLLVDAASAPMIKKASNLAGSLGLDQDTASMGDIASRIMTMNKDDVRQGGGVLSGTANQLFSASNQFFEKIADVPGEGITKERVAKAFGLSENAGKGAVFEAVKKQVSGKDLKSFIKASLGVGANQEAQFNKGSAQENFQKYIQGALQSQEGQARSQMESGVAGTSGMSKTVMDNLQKQVEPLQELAEAVNRLAQNTP